MLGDRETVGEEARRVLDDPDLSVLVSAASYWEIAIKRSLGKLELDDRWAAVLAQLDLAPLSIEPAHATAVERLPWHHRDPFDRLLIAQAQTEGLLVLTPDRRFAAYDVRTAW